MLATGIILCYLLGLSLLLVISRKYSLAELAGYSFLLGMGLETVFMFLLDLIGIKYSASVLTGISVFAIVALCGANYKQLLQLKSTWEMPKLTLKDINLVAVFLLCLIGYLFYAITVKNLFWPSTEHDTIGSFDKLGRIMAIEGKLHISLFKYNLEGAGGVYPPLYHSSFAYVYLFGAEMPKILTTLYFFSLLSVFYSAIKNFVGSTGAALATFILMLTPELFSHAALSLGNLPTTAYVCAGSLATITWLEKNDTKYFWLGAIGMAFVIWIRSDTIVFTAAALLLAGIYFFRTKDWKKTAVYSAMAVAPFIIWNLYLKLKIGVAQSAKFDLSMGYDSERFGVVSAYVKTFLLGGQHGAVDGGQLYGVVFVLFFVMVLINLLLVYKFGARPVLSKGANALLFFAVSFGLYCLVFYFINVKVQNAPISSLMESSFKRGMFFFAPVALFYAFTNYAAVGAFDRLEEFRRGGAIL